MISDLSNNTTIEKLENILAEEKREKLVKIYIEKLDGKSYIMIRVPENKLTLCNIRRRVEQSFNAQRDRVNWKYIWMNYALVLDGKYLLVNNANLDLKLLGIMEKNTLKFKKLVRRRKRNGPIRLRENERDMYILV